MAKRLETIFERLQKDGKKIQEDRDKSAKRPGKMQRDGKKIWNDIKKMVKRPEKTAKRWQKDPENGKDMAERPIIIGKISAGNMAKRRRMILK